MKSKDAENLFSAYLEGELSAEEEDRLRSHFQSHPEDRAAYRAFETTVELARGVPRETVSDDFTDRLMANIAMADASRQEDAVVTMPERRPSRVRFEWPRVAAMAATLGLGFLSGTMLFNAMGDRSSTPDGLSAESSVEAGTGDAAPTAGTAILASDSLLSAPPAWEGEVTREPLQLVNGGEKATIVF